MILDNNEHDSVIEYVYKDFGHVGTKIHELMDEKGISVYRMEELANIQHRIVKKYYDNKVVRSDFEVLAKFCFVLKCDISDVLYYKPPAINDEK